MMVVHRSSATGLVFALIGLLWNRLELPCCNHSSIGVALKLHAGLPSVSKGLCWVHKCGKFSR